MRFRRAAGLVIYLLISLLSGGGGLGQLGPLDDQRVGQDDTPGEVSTARRTGEDANQRQRSVSETSNVCVIRASGTKADPLLATIVSL